MSELTEAIRNGDAAKVASLLDADPDAASTAENGTTPLMLAIYLGKPEIAQLLAGRSPSISFHELCALGDLDRARQLLAADRSLLDRRSADGFPPLGLAIFFRHPELARWLIEEGADVNAAAENAQRVAPLHAAAAVCDRETARLLLERGADPRARQQGDYTPLHGAASRGDVELGNMLLARGADRDAKGADGLTPADVAVKYGHPDWAEKLLA
ncbi:MAG TPA: ankyrin repeat domain-containing protein [Thermoanaerobaculia bacterium]|nr:ankyrin repeat domain-containing protein [Thermoanaerobaculia bacterium]